MISEQALQSSTKKLFSRSSGPGGQNVNKRESKVTLQFEIDGSFLSLPEKDRLKKSFPSGTIHVSAEETRSQRQNLALAFERLQTLIKRKLMVSKPRKKTIAPYRTQGGKRQKTQKAHLLQYKKRMMMP